MNTTSPSAPCCNILMHRLRIAATMVLALLCGPVPAADNHALASEEVMRQIDAINREKRSWTSTQRKISAKLLLTAKRRLGRPMATGMPELSPTVAIDASESVLTDIRGRVTDGLLREIRSCGGEVINAHARYGTIRARLPLAHLEWLAARREVRSIRPAETMRLHKANTSEGVAAHGVDIACNILGVSGRGVRIGVLSDSVEALAALQGSGDLPDVTILPGQASRGSSEGTAMLEIVHDIAPGATLFFATANGGQAQFAQNILDLRAAGCDIILDDILYFAEPVFQDGIVAQAVESVVADGALYFSSAGNGGSQKKNTSGVWEGDYRPAASRPAVIGQGTAHDFGDGVVHNTIRIDSPYLFALQWSDPWGASANDYDLYLLNGTGTRIWDASVDYQDGDDDPLEIIDSSDYNDAGGTLVIINNGGEARFLQLNAHDGELAIATAGGTYGHSAATSAYSVAAVDVTTAHDGRFVGGAENPVQAFSSDGPRRIFFHPDGAPITPGDFSSTGGTVRQKPDLAAADNVSCATPGFNPFPGTSAAVAHAAGIAALLLETGLQPHQFRETLAQTAWDIEDPGFDLNAGWGIINPGLVATPTCSPTTGAYPGDHVQVTVWCATAGATLRYTTDGSEPTAESPELDAGMTVMVPVPGQLLVKGWKEGLIPSATRHADYRRATYLDFNADGKADVALYQPSTATWRVWHQPGVPTVYRFGTGTMLPVPADYDGDGKADYALFERATGYWYILKSKGGSLKFQFGWNRTMPVPGDYDGDGRADLALYNPETTTWYILRSGGGGSVIPFGGRADIPVPADYDGDGATDIAVYRPTNGTWYILYSGGGSLMQQFGWATTLPVPGDYDGDGRADIAIFNRPSAKWCILLSGGGGVIREFGTAVAQPVPADYDGDGTTDLAVYDADAGRCHILQSSTGQTLTLPVPGLAQQPAHLYSLIHSWQQTP